MSKEKYIGMMSGTSLDGVDVVLCAIDKNGCDLLASYEHPFPTHLKEEILAMVSTPVALQKVGEIDHKLGLLLAEAVTRFVEKEAIDLKQVKAIGSHGQTLWHQPEGTSPFSMQLGDPNIIAVRTGVKVVADFRRKDMALGGSGAPFAPAFHRFLFGREEGAVCVANIGGIANLTVLKTPLVGYDAGPGNMLMDGWIARHQHQSYDKEGQWAKEGEVNYALLERMMKDTYFAKAYPKSTGREKFNLAWLHALLEREHTRMKPVDVQRTLLELTALSLSNEVLKFNPDMLLLCGGGAKNRFLVERMGVLMPNIQVGIMAEAEMLEAMMMAWLAYKRLHHEHILLREVTGAKANAILGGVYQ